MSTLLKGLGLVLAVAAATFLSGLAAFTGARAVGLPKSEWGFECMPPLLLGWGGGFGLSLVCVAFTASRRYSSRLAITLLAPLLVSFGVAAIAYFIILSPERRAAASYKEVLSDLQFKPDAVHALIAQARVRPLSGPERNALWDRVWVPRAIPAEDVSFLLDYFERDQSALAGIMQRQPITPEQLRYLYERRKSSVEYSRVLNELASHPLTPPDVLQSLADSPDRHLAAKVRARLSKK
jgi:hypothetical protein